jgi:hypothetical protein
MSEEVSLQFVRALNSNEAYTQAKKALLSGEDRSNFEESAQIVINQVLVKYIYCDAKSDDFSQLLHFAPPYLLDKLLTSQHLGTVNTVLEQIIHLFESRKDELPATYSEKLNNLLGANNNVNTIVQELEDPQFQKCWADTYPIFSKNDRMTFNNCLQFILDTLRNSIRDGNLMDSVKTNILKALETAQLPYTDNTLEQVICSQPVSTLWNQVIIGNSNQNTLDSILLAGQQQHQLYTGFAINSVASDRFMLDLIEQLEKETSVRQADTSSQLPHDLQKIKEEYSLKLLQHLTTICSSQQKDE